MQGQLVARQARFRMCADVFGPSRCLAQFAGIGVLPKHFEMRRTGEDEVIVEFVFDPCEDPKRLERALAKLATLPTIYPNQPEHCEAG